MKSYFKIVFDFFDFQHGLCSSNKGNAVVIWRQEDRSCGILDSGFNHVILIFFERSMRITFALVSLVLTHYLYAYAIQIIHLLFRCCLGLLVYCKKIAGE